MKLRTKARCLALQILYEVDQSTHPIGKVLQDHSEDYQENDAVFSFSTRIINGVYPLVNLLDDQLAKYAPEWPVDQVAIIDRNILRIALWELVFEPETPIKVVINEAIELGKIYGSDSTPRFVNGVLGSLVENQNTIRQQLSPHKPPEI